MTEADHAIERLVRERIGRAFPDHGIVGEEFGTEVGEGSTRWFIDPIDGTHNFARGVPVFATLLAVERGSTIEVAMVSAPALGRRWWAVRGAGSWETDVLGGREGEPLRLHVSRVADIAEAHLVFASARQVIASGTAPGVAGLLDAAWRERGFGDFWGYMLVAEGAAEAMIEVGISPYDLAAPSLVVEEAGGRVSDFGGTPSIEGRTVHASHGVLHDRLLAALRAGG